MTQELVTALVSVLLGLIGLAALAVVLSPSAQTSGVISAGSSGFATDLKAAVSPVTSGGSSMSLPSLGSFSQGVG